MANEANIGNGGSGSGDGKSVVLMVKPGADVAKRPVKLQIEWTRPLVPDDHGAYAMLLLPMLLGFILGTLQGDNRSTSLPAVLALFTISLVCLFLVTEPAAVLFKPTASAMARGRAWPWLAIYLLTAGICGAPLLFVWERWGLGWFLVPAVLLMLFFLVAVKLRKQRSLALRLPGIVGLTLSAPAAYYVAAGTLDAASWGLWAACTVYFVGTIFNVRAWFEVNKLRKAGVINPRFPAWLVAGILVYAAVSALIIWGCILLGALPWTVFVAFVPSALRAAWTLWRTPAHLPIKVVGLIEFAQSFLFALLLIAAIVGAPRVA
jgi:hypothetical protein